MVMVSMCFGAFGPANWGYSTVAVLFAFHIFLFGLPAFSPRLRDRFADRFWMRRLDFVAPHSRVGKRYLSTGRPRARDADTAYTAAYARKHTTELAFNPGLSRRPLQHRLSPLNCLR